MNGITKRLSRTKTKVDSFQATLDMEQIREKLKDYVQEPNPLSINIGTHVRYFTLDPKSREKKFRMGGVVRKIDTENKYMILSNGQLSWSAQIKNSEFYRKMSSDEIINKAREEGRSEVKREMAGGSRSNSHKSSSHSVEKYIEHAKEQVREQAIKNEKLIHEVERLKKELENSKRKTELIVAQVEKEKEKKYHSSKKY